MNTSPFPIIGASDYLDRMQAGQCVGCGEQQVDEGRRYCNRCARRRNHRAEEGLCLHCERELPPPEGWRPDTTCARCTARLDRHRQALRMERINRRICLACFGENDSVNARYVNCEACRTEARNRGLQRRERELELRTLEERHRQNLEQRAAEREQARQRAAAERKARDEAKAIEKQRRIDAGLCPNFWHRPGGDVPPAAPGETKCQRCLDREQRVREANQQYAAELREEEERDHREAERENAERQRNSYRGWWVH